MHHAETPRQRPINWTLLVALVCFAAGCVIMLRLIIITASQTPAPGADRHAAVPLDTPAPTRFAPPRPPRPRDGEYLGGIELTKTAIIGTATAAAMTTITAKLELLTPTPVVTLSPTDVPTATPIAPGDSRSNPLPPGTELRFTNWAVVITDVLYGEEAVRVVAETNPLNAAPGPDQTYLIATMQLTNISEVSEARSTLAAVDLRVTGDRHMLYRQAPAVPPYPPGGQLLPGATGTVQLVFAIGSDERSLLLQVQEGQTPPRFVAVDAGTQLTPPADLATRKATETGRQRDMPAAPGETVITDAWEVTLVEVQRGAAAAELVQATSPLNQPAPEGMEYVAVKLRVRAIATSVPDSATRIDGSFLKLTGTRDIIYERPLVMPPDPILAADLFPGGVVEGWDVLRVPTDEEQVTLIFRPQATSSGDSLRFIRIE